MTIDEAITRERQIAKEQRSHIGTWYSKIMGYDDEYIKKCEVCVEEHEQLAEWLEELKELRATSCGYSKEDIELNRNAMYNKAIDDFERIMCEELKDYIDNKDYMCVGLSLHKFTRDLAEQLKAGGVE